MDERTVDVVVVGAGMSGLCAAIAAALSGATVQVFEVNDHVGGAAVWSAGRIWTFDEAGELRERVPTGDGELQAVLAAEFRGSLNWLRELDLPLVEQAPDRLGNGAVMALGMSGNRAAFLDALADCARAHGVNIKLGTHVSGLVREDGVFLVQCDTDNTIQQIKSRTVVIASGGFQTDPATLRSYLGSEVRHLLIRSSTMASGGGLRMGLSLGASVSRGMAGFYGHTMPMFARQLAPSEFKAATFAFAKEAILVNREGLRFTDEAEGLVEEANAVDAMYQPDGVYFLICDSALSDLVPIELLKGLAARAGVPVKNLMITAGTLDGLFADMGQQWGIDKARLKRTVTSVNVAARFGRGDQLKPPRSRPPKELKNGPFTALACMPSITFPYGGLHVNADLQLLDGECQTLGNVWAAGVDAGGVFRGAYAGGLAWALVSGRLAGAAAAAATKEKGSAPHGTL